MTIASGTSLDVVEMDAASQRGIDDIREIRDHVVLQPVEGRFKVYILDEAHQLTDAAWNALLKLIEEPPPHLVFVFCTTELHKVLPTVRSRCQTFLFARPRLAELTKLLRRVADGEEIEAPDAALSLIARSARGSFRDAVSTLDQLAAATDGKVTVQAVLQLLGAVDEEALFRLCDLIVDRDTAGLLAFVEELADQGQDLARLVTDLLEHLRHLLLVQHMGEVPDSLPVTPETRDRLRSQANQLAEAEVLRLIDLLHVAVDDVRQGGDPRLPLELALVKVTRPGADLSRESTAYRLEQLETRLRGEAPRPAPRLPAAVPARPTATTSSRGPPAETAEGPPVDLGEIQAAWKQSILPTVSERSIPTGSVLAEAQARRARRRPARARVPARRLVPPRPGRGAEERGRPRGRAPRGHRPAPRRRVRARRRRPGRGGRGRGRAGHRGGDHRARADDVRHPQAREGRRLDVDGHEQDAPAGAADAGRHAQGAGGAGQRARRGLRRRRAW